MNAIETRVSQRHATHFEISIGGQISEIFLEFVDSVFRGKRIFTSTNGGIKRAREREKKTLSNRFEIVGEPFVYCLLCKLFLTFGRNFLGEENCPRANGRPCEKQTSFSLRGSARKKMQSAKRQIVAWSVWRRAVTSGADDRLTHNFRSEARRSIDQTSFATRRSYKVPEQRYPNVLINTIDLPRGR